MKPRPTKTREFKRLMRRMGFAEIGQTGSHKKYKHDDGRIVFVSDHPGTIPLGTLRSMIEYAGLTIEEFNDSI